MILLPHRCVLRLSGPDRKTFLQGLITNDINKLQPAQPLYAALLNPQGKVLFDFLLVEQEDGVLLDCWREKSAALTQRLMMYKLRAKVAVAEAPELKVYASPESQIPNPESFADPRHPELGSRLITAEPQTETGSLAAYEAHRLSLGIPDSGDFIDERSFPMEFGLSDLHAISYSKGCYVGQEIVARARTRGALNKALHIVRTPEKILPPAGTPVTINGAEIGQLRSSQGNIGLAVLRLEEAGGSTLTSAGLPLAAALPDWFSAPTPAMKIP